MKLLKTSAVVLGIALCVAACSKSPSRNNANENATANAEAPAAAPVATAPETNAADVNAVVDNNLAGPEQNRKHHRRNDRTDNGPRPPSATTN